MPLPRTLHSSTSSSADRRPLSHALIATSAGASLCVAIGGIVLATELSHRGPFVLLQVATFTVAVAGIVLATALKAAGALRIAADMKRQTELQQSALDSTGAQLTALWEKSPLSIMVFDPNDPAIPVKIVACNPAAIEMHGYSQEELIGKSVDLIEVTPWAGSYGKNWIAELRVKRRLEGTGHHKTKDGRILNIEYFTSLIDVNGKELVIGMDRDATARTRAERALRESEERWQLAVAGSDAGVWDWNILTDTIWFSARWKSMLGFADDEVVNTRESWMQRMHRDDLPALDRDLQAHLQQHSRLFQCEYRMQHKDGSWRWTLARGKAHFDAEGRAVRMLGTHVDITAQKQLEAELRTAKEEAEAADRAKSDFLAVMSHEIRTPMNGVIGFTNLLLDTSLNAEQRDWLLTIRSSGESLVTLINDILDFSKIESGHMELDHHAVPVRRCVEEVLDLLWSKASEKKIELLQSIDEGVPEWIITDGTRLRQVLVNLVGNAIKFTVQGEVEVRVSIAPPKNGRAERVVFSVRDTGMGIPTDRIDRLFKPFSQVDSSTTRKYGGTGLGLAISRRLVQLLGGEIQLTHTSKQGSCFGFEIDAAATSAPEGQAAVAVHPNLHVDLASRHALIVDDNATNRRILSNQLGRWGMSCHAFEKPVDALNYLRDGGAVDVALLDMMMPAMHGVDLADGLTAIRGRDKLPLILLSSVSREELRQFEPEKFFDVILGKPVRQSALLDALHTTLAAGHSAVPMPKAAPTGDLDHSLGLRHPLRVLVAEDNVVNQKLITRLLERLNYSPMLVDNGFACLEALRRNSYDVVLMDCQMPEMDGYAATANIRRGGTGPRNRKLRVIALTASAMVGDRERCLAAGMDDYLTKPIQTPDIIRLLEATSRMND